MDVRTCLEALSLRGRGSGKRRLELTEKIGWDAFPAYAEAIGACIGGVVTHRLVGPDAAVWLVVKDDATFAVTFDDFPPSVSIEPRGQLAEDRLPMVRDRLLAFRDGQAG